jgi:hypothetical protein
MADRRPFARGAITPFRGGLLIGRVRRWSVAGDGEPASGPIRYEFTHTGSPGGFDAEGSDVLVVGRVPDEH